MRGKTFQRLFNKSSADMVYFLNNQVGIVHICEATLTKRLNEFGDTEAGSLNVS